MLLARVCSLKEEELVSYRNAEIGRPYFRKTRNVRERRANKSACTFANARDLPHFAVDSKGRGCKNVPWPEATVMEKICDTRQYLHTHDSQTGLSSHLSTCSLIEIIFIDY